MSEAGGRRRLWEELGKQVQAGTISIEELEGCVVRLLRENRTEARVVQVAAKPQICIRIEKSDLTQVAVMGVKWPDFARCFSFPEAMLSRVEAVVSTRRPASRRSFFRKLAEYYAGDYDSTRNPWSAIKASKFYRKAGLAHEALEITKGIKASSSVVQAALLTTSGAALRDLEDMDSAEELALRARGLNSEGYWAPNLLAAVCFQTGRLEDGHDYAEEALKKGADPELQVETMKSVMASLSSKDRQRMVEFLVAHAPDLYAWMAQYRGESQ
jgi:tetratricopeptide (TPR) repeat protein